MTITPDCIMCSFY